MGICTTLHLRALLFSPLVCYAGTKLVCSAGRWCRHPVYQEYTPPMIYGEDILEPERAGKEWDEKLLLQWEYRVNKGREWEGRSRHGEEGEEREGKERKVN